MIENCSGSKPIEMNSTLSLSPVPAEAVDEVMRRVQPSRVLELGMHCGYTSVRLLRLLPPAGTLVTVEGDPLTAELGEEIILVAGFKHSQVHSGTSRYTQVHLGTPRYTQVHPGTPRYTQVHPVMKLLFQIRARVKNVSLLKRTFL